MESIEALEPLEPITELIEWDPPTQPTQPAQPLDLTIGPLFVNPSWPIVAVSGADRALIYRGRFIEIANRVTSRAEDPATRQRLLGETARLNPEGWVTEDEARAAAAGFDAAYDRIAAELRRSQPV